MLGFMCFSTDAFHSAEHIAECIKFSFTYLFGEMFCGLKASHHSLIHHSLYFLWYTSKLSPLQSPTAHRLHFTCTLFHIPRMKQVWQLTLVDWIGQWLLKFTSSRVTFFFVAAGLPMGRQGWGKLPAFSIRFHTGASWKFLYVISAPHDVRTSKRFAVVMSDRWKKRFFVHFHVHCWTE
jgi:hypothetical protein